MPELDLVSTVAGVIRLFRSHAVKDLTVTGDLDCEKEQNKFCRIIKQYSDFNNIYVLRGVEPISGSDRKTIILNDYHLSATGGHAGINKMINNIKRRYTWLGLSESVRKYVNNCEQCQKAKIVRHNRHELSKTTTASQAFEKIFLD